MKFKKALIFGVTGQDGAYLAKYLFDKSYKIYGLTRFKNKKNIINLIKLKIDKNLNLIQSKIINKKEIFDIIKKISPNEIYYLAGQSSVGLSFKKPIETYKSNNLCLFYILEYCRIFKKKIKVYTSVSSECFGNNKNLLSNEKTPFNPISPYGKSKSFSFWLMQYYRETFEVNTSTGILFNHESPLRKKNFVSKKIVSYALNFKKKSKKLTLGNIKVKRDWGWANDYVKAIHLINSHKENSDYVIGSGKQHSLNDFIKIIFKLKNIPFNMIRESKKLKRENEIIKNCADPKKIRKKLKWKSNFSLKQIALKLINDELY